MMFNSRTTVSPFNDRADDIFTTKRDSKDCTIVDMEKRYGMDDLSATKRDKNGKSVAIKEEVIDYGDFDLPKEDENWLPEPFGPFADKAIRKAFIRKVYGILAVQLSFTIVLGIIFLSV